MAKEKTRSRQPTLKRNRVIAAGTGGKPRGNCREGESALSPATGKTTATANGERARNASFAIGRKEEKVICKTEEKRIG